jgi:hypothetical protein
LKRLAEAHVFYELDSIGVPDQAGKLDRVGKIDRAAFGWRSASSAAIKPLVSRAALAAEGISGPWDTFSTRNLALRVNRHMAREFAGDAERIRAASVAAVSRALSINPSRWNPAEREALNNWSLVLALIPDLSRWSRQEKQAAAQIIRAQAGPNEMRYLRLTQQHPRLREELLRLGS